MADYANITDADDGWKSVAAVQEDIWVQCLRGAVLVSTKSAPAELTGITLNNRSDRLLIPAGTVWKYRSISSGAATVIVREATGGASITGVAAHDAPINGAPLRVGARAISTNFAAVAAGDAVDLAATTTGAQIVMPFSSSEESWRYAAAAGGVTATADVVLAATAGTGKRRYVTSIQLANPSANATEVVLKDGSTVIWRGHLPANAPLADIEFQMPLRTTANAALNFACVTAGAAVYVNAQGYTAP